MLMPPFIGGYPFFWSPLLAGIVVFLAWSQISANDYKIRVKPVRGVVTAMVFLLASFLIVSSFSDFSKSIYFAICILAYVAGLSGVLDFERPESKWTLALIFSCLFYLSLISSSFNSSDTSGVRSNYIGISILTCGLLWIDGFKSRRNKWAFLGVIFILACLTATRSVILGLIFAVLIFSMRSWRVAAMAVLSVIVIVFVANINMDTILNEYLSVAQDMSIAYSGKPLDTGRSELWLEAIRGMELWQFVFGYDAYELESLKIDPSGVHNGYLYLFLSGGGVAIGLCAVIIVFSVKYMWKTKPNLTSVFILALLVKECFEVTFFAGNLAFAVPFWLVSGVVANKYIARLKNEKK